MRFHEIVRMASEHKSSIDVSKYFFTKKKKRCENVLAPFRKWRKMHSWKHFSATILNTELNIVRMKYVTLKSIEKWICTRWLDVKRKFLQLVQDITSMNKKAACFTRALLQIGMPLHWSQKVLVSEVDRIHCSSLTDSRISANAFNRFSFQQFEKHWSEHFFCLNWIFYKSCNWKCFDDSMITSNFRIKVDHSNVCQFPLYNKLSCRFNAMVASLSNECQHFTLFQIAYIAFVWRNASNR